jgi:hypothetical protein
MPPQERMENSISSRDASPHLFPRAKRSLAPTDFQFALASQSTTKRERFQLIRYAETDVAAPFKKASKSALICSALVAGIPCGKPG